LEQQAAAAARSHAAAAGGAASSSSDDADEGLYLRDSDREFQQFLRDRGVPATSESCSRVGPLASNMQQQRQRETAAPAAASSPQNDELQRWWNHGQQQQLQTAPPDGCYSNIVIDLQEFQQLPLASRLLLLQLTSQWVESSETSLTRQ
jgi:hypothetical protein